MLLFNTNKNFAQDTLQPVKFSKAYLKSFLLDSKDVVIAPYHWRGTQWAVAGGAIATTGLLITNDKAINHFFQYNRTHLSNQLSKQVFEPFGSGKYSFPLLAGFGLHHAITKSERSGRVFYLGTKSIALSGLLVTVLKNTFQRHRPFQDTPANPYNWDFFSGNFKYHSFPSGHTMVAFSVATIIATEYHDYPIVPVLCYTIAALTGLSRIHDNKHYASDVFMGATLGFSVSKMIYFRNNWKINLAKKKSVLVAVN